MLMALNHENFRIYKFYMLRIIFRNFCTLPARISGLHSQLASTANGIQDYNFRSYFLRKVDEVGVSGNVSGLSKT